MGKISDAMQSVADEIRSSAETRGTALRALLNESKQLMKDIHRTNVEEAKATRDMLEQFDREHEDVAKALREKLSSEDKARVEASREFMEDVGVTISEIRSATQNLLERFGLEHGDMAKALREKLSSERKAGAETSRQFMEEVHNTNSECREAVRRMLDEVASDLGQAHQIWTKGLGKKVVPEAVVKKAVQEIKKKAETEKEKILEVIARHPEGIRLVDIGNERGVDWRTLIGPTKSLVDEDKMEKIDNMYYPKKEE
jgi:hypothetical protein